MAGFDTEEPHSGSDPDSLATDFCWPLGVLPVYFGPGMPDAIRDLVEPTDSAAILETAHTLLPMLYGDLRRLARRERRRFGRGETLRTTALVHEAFLKLRGTSGFSDRSHFLRASAIAMRHILVNHARDRMAAKRGGGIVPLELDHDQLAEPSSDGLLVEVNEALGQLATLNLRLARVVECRFFAGYSDEETAEALGVTDRTVRRDWIKARAWLLRELTAQTGPSA